MHWSQLATISIPPLGDSGKLLLFCLFGTACTLLLRRSKGRM
jgi:hypothetical protein